jgi:hypothetical protein
MKLILISPEKPNEFEEAIYQTAFDEPKIAHIHIRRHSPLTNQEWDNLRPFASKLVYSVTCGHPPFKCKGSHGLSSGISVSAHCIEEALRSREQYCYISPIYPSISKKGYSNSTLLGDIKQRCNIPKNWVALGGVSAVRIPEIKQLGFEHAAILGAIWESANPMESFLELLDAL